MMVFGATRASADDVDLGLPPARRLSSSVDGCLGNGRRRGGGGGRDGATAVAAVPEIVVLVLGNFQGVVVLDMGIVKVRSYLCWHRQPYDRTQQMHHTSLLKKNQEPQACFIPVYSPRRLRASYLQQYLFTSVASMLTVVFAASTYGLVLCSSSSCCFE